MSTQKKSELLAAPKLDVANIVYRRISALSLLVLYRKLRSGGLHSEQANAAARMLTDATFRPPRLGQSDDFGHFVVKHKTKSGQHVAG